ncbi:type II secretion system protein N [Sphingopyxis yananensis]|uniref:type II secretion system protein N n=1 Tax=Sphingopyxis yananensis TaxID=2886687 RepID=UPI001D0FED8E|nr:type II secretion system protein N [Sphingopyxis yananensis]MCC2601982.1 PDZ domain-containing protein [Sphingopyxis yananensis]
MSADIGTGRPRLAALWPHMLVALLAAAVIVQAVRLLWALVVPLSPLGAWQPKGADILPFSQRASLFSAFDPFFRSVNNGPVAANVTSMALVLHGISMNEATGGGSAIISGEDGVQNSFAVGDEVAAGTILAAVAFDHVVLERGGVRESLFLDQGGDEAAVQQAVTGQPATGQPAVGQVPAAPVAEPALGAGGAGAALTAEALKQGVRFSPRAEGGKVTGVHVAAGGDGAVMQASGLRAGDVIRSVNGRAISGAGDVAALSSMLRAGARISLEVERGASLIPIAILIAKS